MLRSTIFITHLVGYVVLALILYPGAGLQGNQSLPYIVGEFACGIFALIVVARMFTDAIAGWVKSGNGDEEESRAVLDAIRSVTPDTVVFGAFMILAIAALGLFGYNAKEGDMSTTWFWVVCGLADVVAIFFNFVMWKVALKRLVQRKPSPTFRQVS